VPKTLKGLHFEPALTSIVFFGPDPGVVRRMNPSLRKYVVGLPKVAWTRLLACASLYQSRAVPEFLPLPVQAFRTSTLRLIVDPDGKLVGLAGIGIVF
jgi:hypothetical protein